VSGEVSALEALRTVAQLFERRTVDEGRGGGLSGGESGSLDERSCFREPVATREGEVGGFVGEVEGEIVGSSAAGKEITTQSQDGVLSIA